MIKNEIQLSSVRNRISELNAQLERINDKYKGIELELLSEPILDEIREFEYEIQEYELLRSLSLEDAISSLLRQPVLLEDISDLLAKLRIAAGLTQEDLATRLGWQQSNLSRFENSNYSSQTVAKVLEYASALQVWLHVCPSASEIPVTETDTDLHVEWNKSILTAGEEDLRIPTLFGPADNTLGTFRKAKIIESPQNTQFIVLGEPQDAEFEYA
jgi:transcriptional regulator with XRE-family HTH domain